MNFKSCLPGWYPGRTIHIHFAVSDASGSSRIVSQFGFEDAIATQVYTTHPMYSHRGDQDTPLDRDGVFQQIQEPFVMSTQQNSDGSLRSTRFRCLKPSLIQRLFALSEQVLTVLEDIEGIGGEVGVVVGHE